MEARIIGRVFLCSLSRKVAPKTAKTVGGTVIRTKKTTTAAVSFFFHQHRNTCIFCRMELYEHIYQFIK
jgi:hypothetical protein